MKFKIENLLVASLLAGTAIVPAAMAQQTQQTQPATQQGAAAGQEVAGGQACVQLEQVVENHGDDLGDDWTDAAERAVSEGTPQACEQYLAEAEQELGPEAWEQEQARFQEQQAGAGAQAEVDAAAEIEAELAVRQAPPEVTVQQDAPDVAIQQAAPEVAVQQAQPRVTVRQPEPEVIVRMPDPEVIVNMPEPEITVEMPEPQVEVSQQQPQVEIQQDQPTVDVSQPAPQIDVNVDDTVQQAEGAQQDQEQADVLVEQDQPQVQLSGEQDPQVQIDQAQPQVTYEAAEPVVRIERQGEGQPAQEGQQLTAQDAQQQDDEQLTAQEGQEQEDQQQTGQPVAATGAAPQQDQMTAQDDADDTWRGDRQAFAQPTTQREGYQEAQANEISIDNLMGANVYGENDNSIGSINDVVMGSDGQVEYVVVDVGGFLGLGARSVAIGLDELQVVRADDGGDLRAYVAATQQELENAPEYQSN